MHFIRLLVLFIRIRVTRLAYVQTQEGGHEQNVWETFNIQIQEIWAYNDYKNSLFLAMQDWATYH